MRQVIEPERRHLGPAEHGAGENAAVTRDHVVVAINQNRDIEAKGPDAVGDLPDLLLTVEPRINGVGLKFSNQAVPIFKNLGSAAPGLFGLLLGDFIGSLRCVRINSAHRRTRTRRTYRVQEPKKI